MTKAEHTDPETTAVAAARRGRLPELSVATEPAPDTALDAALRALLDGQRPDGHWVFDFEADCTIPAEYVLWMHWLDEVDAALQEKFARYIRARQAGGGWPLYHGGPNDLSGSVKAYWALKLAGDDPDAPHMRAAREWILSMGGAERSNGFTRSLLARAGLVPWRAAPFAPVEILLLPGWFPFHFSRMSYWARAVMVPMTVLHSLKVRGQNPTGRTVRELFHGDPERIRAWGRPRSWLNRRFMAVENALRWLEPLVPGVVRRRALRVAADWMRARLNGIDGLGGVFPSMVNTAQALLALGHDRRSAEVATAIDAVRKLVVEREHDAFCQPCLSPVWDTALSALAIDEVRRARAVAAGHPEIGHPEVKHHLAGRNGAPPPATPGAGAALDAALQRAGEWLVARQITDHPGDWQRTRPHLPPGGWPFQYANGHYPDVDDACAVVWALGRVDPQRFRDAIGRGADWVRGMQSSNGGFAAFDVDNDSMFLQALPVGDSGPLLDPPTADVTGRAAAMFALLGRSSDGDALRRAVDYLLAEQEHDGAWFGRWGTNYIYGTWSVLLGLEHVRGDERVDAARRRAVRWLESVQQADGGFGESNGSYEDPSLRGGGQESTSYQTAWAMLAMMTEPSADPRVLERAADFLARMQRADGTWDEPWFSAPGFPRVFYLRYLGYSLYFPVWALARHERWRRETARG